MDRFTSVPFFYRVNFRNIGRINNSVEVICMDRHIEKSLLMTELEQYYRNLELAELYDNIGDREFFKSMIVFTEEKLSDLYTPSEWVLESE